MMEKAYLQIICFLSLLSIFGIYLGYLNKIYPITAVFAIAVSLILAWVLTRDIKTRKIESEKKLALILIIFFIIVISSSLPNLVFPHGAGDFQNHARSVRIIAKNHSFSIPRRLLLIFPHKYPQVYYGIASIFYSLYPHTYVVNSLFSILLEILSLLGLFLIAKKFFDEKIALLSVFIFGFAITNIFILEQGYFTYLLAQFFFISSVYLFLINEKELLILANIGLVAYPHIFAVYMIFILLESIKSKKIGNFIVPSISILIIAPETLGLFWRYFLMGPIANVPKDPLPFRGIFLIKGGIITPPILSLLILGFAIIGIYFERKKSFLNLNLCILVLMSMVIGAFAFDFFFGYTKDIHHLYLVVKLFYLLLIPLSIAVALGIDRTIKGNTSLAILLVLYLSYFAGYAFVVLPSKANFPGEAYEAFEKMDNLDGEFKVGVDLDLINNKGWMPRFPYKSVIDAPDTGYLTGEIAKVELRRALQFHWADYTFKGGLKVINSKGEDVIKYTMEEVDYYITTKDLDEPKIFEEGDINIYKIKEGWGGI